MSADSDAEEAPTKGSRRGKGSGVDTKVMNLYRLRGTRIDLNPNPQTPLSGEEMSADSDEEEAPSSNP